MAYERSLKMVQIEFETYANQLVQANENEAHINNQSRRFEVILNFRRSSPPKVWCLLSHPILRIKLNAKPYVCPEINHT